MVKQAEASYESKARNFVNLGYLDFMGPFLRNMRISSTYSEFFLFFSFEPLFFGSLNHAANLFIFAIFA